MTDNDISGSVNQRVRNRRVGTLSLRHRLLITFILLAALPVLVTGIVSGLINTQGLRNAAFNQLASVTELKTAEIASWVSSLRVNLDLISQDKDVFYNASRVIQNSDDADLAKLELRNKFKSVNETTGYFEELFIMDRDGAVILSTDASQEGKIFSSQAFYGEALNGTYITPPVYDVSITKYSIIFSQPIKNNNGGVIGVAAGRANLAVLDGIMVERVGLGETGETYLIGSNYALLSRLRDEEAKIGEAYIRTTGTTNAIRSRNAGSGLYNGYSDVSVIGSYRWIPELQVALIAEQSESEALQASSQAFRFTLGLMALTLVIAVGIAFLTTRSIVTPISQLVTIAENITSGNFEVNAQAQRGDEIGVLATAFNTMSSRLRDLIGTLEQRVADRTKALASVAEVSTAASTILETDKLLQEVVDLTKERFGFYHAHIYLLNDTGDTLVLTSGAGEPGRKMVAEGRSIPLDREQSLVARAAREKRGVTVNDVTQTRDFLPNPLLPDTHSEMAVPMTVGEQVIGVFDVQSEIVGRFTDADISVQITLASQVAAAVLNARSYTQIREAQQLTRTIIDSTDDWIFLKDRDHRYVLVNQGYANSLHIPIDDFIGKDDLDLGFPEELVKGHPEKGIRGFWTDDMLVFETGKAQRFPDDPATIDGVVHIFDTVKIPLRDADGHFWAVLGFARDITERKHLEEMTAQRARQQEAINLITQKVQDTITIEEALQVAAREVGHALGGRETIVVLEPPVLAMDSNKN